MGAAVATIATLLVLELALAFIGERGLVVAVALVAFVAMQGVLTVVALAALAHCMRRRARCVQLEARELDLLPRRDVAAYERIATALRDDLPPIASPVGWRDSVLAKIDRGDAGDEGARGR